MFSYTEPEAAKSIVPMDWGISPKLCGENCLSEKIIVGIRSQTLVGVGSKFVQHAFPPPANLHRTFHSSVVSQVSTS